ncbi:hypothetical protein [Luedemannella helvata]|uniref:IPT/TIG domain-containing protein n=1 Tax=Luedemannella helvata TaxID=349315 RepID=A0ABP4WSX7_9ACTN
MTLRKGVAAFAAGALVVLGAAMPAQAGPVAVAAAPTTITQNYMGPFGCNYFGEYVGDDYSGWDNAWVYELTGVGGQNGVPAPRTITVGLTTRGGGRITVPVPVEAEFGDAESYPNNTAFYVLYPVRLPGTPDGTASAVIDSAWNADKEAFYLSSMPCTRPTLTVDTSKVTVQAGATFTVSGRLRTAAGGAAGGREIGAYFFPEGYEGKGDVPATVTTTTSANGRFTLSLCPPQNGYYTIWYDGDDTPPAPGEFYAAAWVDVTVVGTPPTSAGPVVTTGPTVTTRPVVTTGPPVTTEPPTSEGPVTTQPPLTLPPDTPEPPDSSEPPVTVEPPTSEAPVTTESPVTTTAPPVTAGPSTSPEPTDNPPVTTAPPATTPGPVVTTAPPDEEPPVDPPVGPTLPDTLPESDGPLTLPRGTEIRAGSDVLIVGAGFAPNTPVTIGIYSQPVVLKTVTSNDDGEIRAVVSIPKNMSGDHTIVAAGEDSVGEVIYLTVPVSIEEAVGTGGNSGSGGSSGGLPITGVAVAGMSLTGVALVGAGIMMFLAARRRRLELAPATASAADTTTTMVDLPAVSDAATQVLPKVTDVPTETDMTAKPAGKSDD